jgi:hypothetical protein
VLRQVPLRPVHRLVGTRDQRVGGGGGGRTLADRQRLVGAAHLAADDQELVATEAAHQVAVADRAEEPLADVGEQPVAGRVAQPVVEVLELVEADEDHRRAQRLSNG